VCPDPRLDPPRSVAQLEREIRRAGTGLETALLRHRVDTLDRSVLGELGDHGHVSELLGPTTRSSHADRCPGAVPRRQGPSRRRPTAEGSPGFGYPPPVADVRPFRAVRFSRSAGPLPALVAPPYDVISESDRRRLAERNEHNVVHLTLN